MNNYDLSKFNEYEFNDNKKLLEKIYNLEVYNDIGMYEDTELYAIIKAYIYCNKDPNALSSDNRIFAENFVKKFKGVFLKTKGIKIKEPETPFLGNYEKKIVKKISIKTRMLRLVFSTILIFASIFTISYFSSFYTIEKISQDLSIGFYAILNSIFTLNYNSFVMVDTNILVKFIFAFLIIASSIKLAFISFGLTFAVNSNEENISHKYKKAIKNIVILTLPMFIQMAFNWEVL